MRIAAFFYGAWCIFWTATALTNIGEAREGAHLVLALTGAPAALASLYLQHASMLGTIAAGLLGLVQWVLVTGWISGEPPVVLSTSKDTNDDL
jgi:hypothetical protein